jgi:hypothetical protein
MTLVIDWEVRSVETEETAQAAAAPRLQTMFGMGAVLGSAGSSEQSLNVS